MLQKLYVIHESIKTSILGILRHELMLFVVEFIVFGQLQKCLKNKYHMIWRDPPPPINPRLLFLDFYSTNFEAPTSVSSLVQSFTLVIRYFSIVI